MARHHYLCAAAILIAACSTERETIEHQDKLAAAAADLNKACATDAECPSVQGDAVLTCGDAELEQGQQCVIEGCPSKGPGPKHGCPENAFCYVFDNDDGHYCTRICNVDADCQAINPALVCRERASTEESGLMICVRND